MDYYEVTILHLETVLSRIGMASGGCGRRSLLDREAHILWHGVICGMIDRPRQRKSSRRVCA